MPKFLHTADWQIGRTFTTWEAEAAHHLTQARFAAVRRIAQLATQHAVDAVLVAGDVFDAQTVSDKTIRRLFQELQGFAGPWILISGNHDAALAQSVWTRARNLDCVPPNVHLLLTPEVASFDGFAVLPAPLTQRHCYDDVTAWMDNAVTAPGLLRIGLAHGSVQGLLHEGIDSPNPIHPQRAALARLDWLALGDWHGMQLLDAHTAYSGTPEADRLHGNDPGHALLVEIAAPGATPQVQVLDVGQYRWQRLQAHLQLPSDWDALLSRLAALDANDVVQLRLQGAISWAQQQQLQAALDQAEAKACALQVERSGLRLLPTDEELAALRADGYVGDVLNQLRQESAAQPEAGVVQDALELLTQALWQQQAASSASTASTAATASIASTASTS